MRDKLRWSIPPIERRLHLIRKAALQFGGRGRHPVPSLNQSTTLWWCACRSLPHISGVRWVHGPAASSAPRTTRTRGSLLLPPPPGRPWRRGSSSSTAPASAGSSSASSSPTTSTTSPSPPSSTQHQVISYLITVVACSAQQLVSCVSCNRSSDRARACPGHGGAAAGGRR